MNAQDRRQDQLVSNGAESAMRFRPFLHEICRYPGARLFWKTEVNILGGQQISTSNSKLNLLTISIRKLWLTLASNDLFMFTRVKQA